MEFYDRVMKCATCGEEFLFSADEQAFFKEKSFRNDPKHCKQCKARTAGRLKTPTQTTVNCADCGKSTTVPFKPVHGRPVFCRECFGKK